MSMLIKGQRQKYGIIIQFILIIGNISTCILILEVRRAKNLERYKGLKILAPFSLYKLKIFQFKRLKYF